MFYLIPAWYQERRPWYDRTEPWYREGQHGFDDTIHHLRLLSSADQKSQLLVLNYQPNLRYFTHQYDLLEVPVWSLFDDLQGIRERGQQVLNFRDLNWPVGTSFIYTPFLVLAHYNHQHLATIEFGPDGQLIWVDYYQDNHLNHRLVFDDRGFLSSILYYQDGQEHHQDYLNSAGKLQFREYLLSEDKRVVIGPETAERFAKSCYANMSELVAEKIAAHLSQTDQSDEVILLASHPQHNDLILAHKGKRRLVLSYSKERFERQEYPQLQEDLVQADVIVADRLGLVEQLAPLAPGKIEHLSPFDTRLSLGKSQRLKQLPLYMLVDGLSQDQLVIYLDDIISVMTQNELITLSLVTYGGPEASATEKMIKEYFALQNIPDLYLTTAEQASLDDGLGNDEGPASRVTFSYLGTELAIQQALEKARLIVDLQEEPDLYTQIAGISAGIPQVNTKESEFLVHLKTGYLISQPADLSQALSYYLTGLANWNRALVHTVQKIEDYTSGRLVERLMNKIRQHDQN